jgi:hypothetical protein
MTQKRHGKHKKYIRYIQYTAGTRLRRGVAGTTAAVAAMAALTASQAPSLLRTEPVSHNNSGAQGENAPEPTNDDSYHTELPPLRASIVPLPLTPPSGGGIIVGEVWTQAGIPATVLAAYRQAETRLGRADPSCNLPWQLLAAIGKVESGQARGGRVDAQGTTLSPILGPVLNGDGFANISDTDDGAYDGDATYDRAVGPMQFIPSTWARWGQDANGDGRRDPNNIYDAALAAGHYLCAGQRNLTVKADLDRAILSYNHSTAYLRTVLSWLSFYRQGSHAVPDGKGVLPTSPGAGGKTPATQPVGGGGGGGGGGDIIVGPPPGQPTHNPRPRPSSGPGPRPGPPAQTTPPPSDSPAPDPSTSASPSPDPTTGPTPDPSPTLSPCATPSPTESPSEPADPSPSPGATPSDGPCSPAGG